MPRFASLSLLCLTIAAGGCQMGQLVGRQSPPQVGDGTEIIYRTDQPSRVTGEVRTVSLDELGGDPIDQLAFGSDWRSATLSIRAADQTKEPEYLATLALDRRSTIDDVRGERQPYDRQTGPATELWTLTLSQRECQTLFEQLHEHGCFAGQTRPGAGAEFTVLKDGRSETKEWSSDPVLESLMARVYREGHLAGIAAPNVGLRPAQ